MITKNHILILIFMFLQIKIWGRLGTKKEITMINKIRNVLIFIVLQRYDIVL